MTNRNFVCRCVCVRERERQREGERQERWPFFSLYYRYFFIRNSLSNWFPYNSQCSSQQVPSSMPITHFPLPPDPHQPSVYSQSFSVSYGLPPSLSNVFISPSPPPWSSVKFLRIHRVLQRFLIPDEKDVKILRLMFL